MTPEIKRLVEVLRLSPGDLLGLAREVTQNATLRSIDNVTEHQRRNLIDMLTFLATPAGPRYAPKAPKQLVAA